MSRLYAGQHIPESPSRYAFSNGMTMEREHGITPNGNPVNGRWVLRSAGGEWIDCDQYRSDLAERHDLQL